MLKTIYSFLRFALDILIPRFITEDVALAFMGGGAIDNVDSYAIVCAMADIEPGERFDAIATVDAFQFLGFGMTYRIGNVRLWPK